MVHVGDLPVPAGWRSRCAEGAGAIEQLSGRTKFKVALVHLRTNDPVKLLKYADDIIYDADLFQASNIYGGGVQMRDIKHFVMRCHTCASRCSSLVDSDHRETGMRCAEELLNTSESIEIQYAVLEMARSRPLGFL